MLGLCEKWVDMVVKLLCVAAVIVQLGFNLKGFLHPKLPTTQVHDVALKDLDSFPLIVKICAQPGFNQTALYEVGYSGLWQYFKGKSRFNSGVFGWAGHTRENTTWGGVEETFEKVRINPVADIMEKVCVKLNTEEYLSFADQVYLGKINYPHNCYTLDLTKSSRLRGRGVKTMIVRLKTEQTFQAMQIQLQGKTLATQREIYDHTVFSTGDALTAKSGEHRKFAVRIEENIFVEEDDNKNCQEYPNSDFESYSDCDNHFTRSICSKAALTPIWMADQLENVTAHAVFQKSGNSE